MKKTILLVLFIFFCLATQGLAQEKSEDEVAKELANPNNSLAKLTFKNQYRWYTGDLPNAEDQDIRTITPSCSSPYFLSLWDLRKAAVIPFFLSAPPFPFWSSSPTPSARNG